MRIYTIILTMMLVPALTFASCNNVVENGRGINKISNPPDSSIVKILGDTIADVIFNPKKVSAYKLKKVFDTVALKAGDCENFVKDSLLQILKPETYGALDFVLLSDTANYKLDSVKIRSQYYPLLEFEFQKKKECVKVRISTNDYCWTIIRDNKVISRFNYYDKKLVERLCNLFL